MSTDAYIILTFAIATLALFIALTGKVRRQITIVHLVQPPLHPLPENSQTKTIADIELPFKEVSHV
jgi:hypothetical protein